MKKITLLFLLLTATFSYSQIVLDENFDAALALPAGWTNNAIIPGPGPNIWTFETGGFAPLLGDGNTAFYTDGEFAGNYPILNSDGYGAGPEEVALESPAFDCTGLTAITLSFKHFFVSGYGGEGHVEVFDGTTWIEVDLYAEPNPAANSFVAGPVVIDVSTELAGVTNAQVRFRWVGDFSYYWAFDEVSVFECTVAAPNAVATPTPTDTAIDIPIDYTGAAPLITPFSWVESGIGDPADTFNLTLGTDMAGTNIGTVSGATNGNGITYGSWANSTTYYWFITAVNCAGETAGPVWSFTTAVCTNTAPGITGTPGPADTATGVILNDNGGNPSLNFSWVEGTGDPADAFTLNFGTANPPDQAFTGFTNGDPLAGLAINTTYYWSVDAVNCGGITAGPVWSFTTGNTLSVEENDVDLFNVFPNPVKDIVKIDTSLDIADVTIVNGLGQTVMHVKGDRILNNSLNLSSLKAGMYFMSINAEGKFESIKIIKE